VVTKRSKKRIIFSRLLFTIFAAGQIIVFSHYHHRHAKLIITKAPLAPQSIQQSYNDKCPLCDAMHYTHIVLSPQVYAQPAPANYRFFTPGCYNFVSISLILSPGRAPPVS
jgi:hypothetical protein